MGKLFGTDGVRGVANTELTGRLAYELGRAGAYVLTKETYHTPRILVGMDTRISGDMLESALTAGICSMGAHAVLAGIVPTPAVAYLVRKYKLDAGIVISASHNPVEYNGIKLEDLYVLENGVRVFNLYKDLNFTDEESALIRRIADDNKEFNDVFDGNNHSINNLTLPLNNKYAYIGLFDKTTVNSCIKNLTLVNCKITDNKDEYCALLTGSNKGIIENCHIIGGSITNTKNVRFAGFTYYNAGYLVNCSISGFNIGNTYGTLGCLTHQNDKDIINCRITNDLNRHPEGATSSVTTITNNGNIYNVFVEKYISSLWGVCNVNKRTGQFYNCIIPNYYSSQYIKDNNNPNASPSTGIYFYEYTAEEYHTIADKLNNWIDNEGKNNYPQFTFRRWKTDDSQKVIFE